MTDLEDAEWYVGLHTFRSGGSCFKVKVGGHTYALHYHMPIYSREKHHFYYLNKIASFFTVEQAIRYWVRYHHLYSVERVATL